jgi:flagellar motor switch protein FliN/FliY
MSTSPETPPNLSILLDIPVQVTVELGSCSLSMKEILQLAPGSVVQLDKVANAPVDLYVNERLFARGEIVMVEDQYGLKVTEIIVK